MVIKVEWRGLFTRTEYQDLHDEAFGDEEKDVLDWPSIVASNSLGWVTARDVRGLTGFINVLWDGSTHAWLQDVMVAKRARHQGTGKAMVEAARRHAYSADCEWLHVDFDPPLTEFYIDACGFTPTSAGLMALRDRSSTL